MSETTTSSPNKSLSVVSGEVLTMLRWMTTGVLERAGVQAEVISRVHDIEFKIVRPYQRYDLKIYSLPEGRSGFNVSTLVHPDADISAREVIYIDRGTNLGSAFDNKGTVYRHGGFDPGPEHQNIDTGSIEDLIFDFYDNPHGWVNLRLIANNDRPIGSRATVTLHPLADQY